MPVQTIVWKKDHVRIIDQTCLPTKLSFVDIYDYHTMVQAIKTLQIRGAPAIGIAGAYGVVLGANQFQGEDVKKFRQHVKKVIQALAETRPTAVNLFWALERMRKILDEDYLVTATELQARLLQEAHQILAEDKQICRRIGQLGAALITQPQATILTHCNAGGLATADYGTALGVIYAAVEQGKKIRVYADETRPLLQGARLTAWELQQSGIEVTVICDNMAAFLMAQERIDYIIVGADRIARNGDVANKIGTYNLAVLAEKHHIPFWVAAPLSTFDFNIDSGTQIPIEERSPDEIIHGFGRQTCPPGVKVYNPAFDVTPHQLISAIITEEKVLLPPLDKNITLLKKNLDLNLKTY